MMISRGTGEISGEMFSNVVSEHASCADSRGRLSLQIVPAVF